MPKERILQLVSQIFPAPALGSSRLRNFVTVIPSQSTEAGLFLTVNARARASTPSSYMNHTTLTLVSASMLMPKTPSSVGPHPSSTKGLLTRTLMAFFDSMIRVSFGPMLAVKALSSLLGLNSSLATPASIGRIPSFRYVFVRAFSTPCSLICPNLQTRCLLHYHPLNVIVPQILMPHRVQHHRKPLLACTHSFRPTNGANSLTCDQSPALLPRHPPQPSQLPLPCFPRPGMLTLLTGHPSRSPARLPPPVDHLRPSLLP